MHACNCAWWMKWFSDSRCRFDFHKIFLKNKSLYMKSFSFSADLAQMVKMLHSSWCTYIYLLSLVFSSRKLFGTYYIPPPNNPTRESFDCCWYSFEINCEFQQRPSPNIVFVLVGKYVEHPSADKRSLHSATIRHSQRVTHSQNSHIQRSRGMPHGNDKISRQQFSKGMNTC